MVVVSLVRRFDALLVSSANATLALTTRAVELVDVKSVVSIVDPLETKRTVSEEDMAVSHAVPTDGHDMPPDAK